MSASALILDPTAPPAAEPQALRRSLDGLRGKVVGFIDNRKPNFNHLVDDGAEVLVNQYGVASVLKRGKRATAMPAPEEVYAELVDQCDLVITGSGD